jgi:hypothetical protein
MSYLFFRKVLTVVFDLETEANKTGCKDSGREKTLFAIAKYILKIYYNHFQHLQDVNSYKKKQ